MTRPALTLGAAMRPFPGEVVSGDLWRADWSDDVCRISVIDALGHGPEAARIAELAGDLLAANPDLEPIQALHACHSALRGTRGAAVAIARLDVDGMCLRYAAVGNVEARLRVNGQCQRPIAYRGIVGVAMRTLRVFDLPLYEGWLLLLHTDGVSARLDFDALPHGLEADPQALADAVLEGWGRPTDDATVVVARAAA